MVEAQGLKVTRKCYLARGECPSVLGIPAAGCCSLMCRKGLLASFQSPSDRCQPSTIPYLTALLPSASWRCSRWRRRIPQSRTSRRTQRTFLFTSARWVQPSVRFRAPPPHPPQEPMLLTACLPRCWTGPLSLWPLVRGCNDGPVVTLSLAPWGFAWSSSRY